MTTTMMNDEIDDRTGEQSLMSIEHENRQHRILQVSPMIRHLPAMMSSLHCTVQVRGRLANHRESEIGNLLC